jgi:hypothetical protein
VQGNLTTHTSNTSNPHATTAAQTGAPNVVVHGATAGTARPAGATLVLWIGSVAPTNAATNDWWWDTSVELSKRWSGTAWKASGSAAYPGLNAAFAETPDVAIFQLGVNDYYAQTSLATFQTNLNATLQYARATKGATTYAVVGPTTNDTAAIPWSSYQNVIRGLTGGTTGIGLIDLSTKWGDVYTSGYMADATHPNDFGYFDLARTVYDSLMRP